MDSPAAPNEGPEGLNHWQYEDDVFPLTAHPRLLNTWKLIEAWLRILQLLALLGVLTWSMFFLPELLRISFTSNLNQHAPALKHLQSTTTGNDTQHPRNHSLDHATVETRGFCRGLSIIRLGVPRPIKGHFRLACFGLPSRNGIGQCFWGNGQLDLLARKSMANIGLRVAVDGVPPDGRGWMVASEYRTSRPFRRTVLGGPQKRRRVHHRRLGLRQTHVGMVCQRLPAATLSMTLGV